MAGPLAGVAREAISGYITGYRQGGRVADTAQKRALKSYRKRLTERGMARFEVLGLHADRELIRSLARRLADKDPQATRIRATVTRTISDDPPKKGGAPSALRRSPLVGAERRSAL